MVFDPGVNYARNPESKLRGILFRIFSSRKSADILLDDIESAAGLLEVLDPELAGMFFDLHGALTNLADWQFTSNKETGR